MVSFNYSQTSKRSLWSRFGGITRSLHPIRLPRRPAHQSRRRSGFLFYSMMPLAL